MNNVSRILVVDDDAYFCSLMGLYLKAHGHEVEVAATGRAGLDSVQRAAPELILTDFQMPQMDGFALFNAVRSAPATAQVPIVMITAHRSRDMQRAASAMPSKAAGSRPARAPASTIAA